jgi:hypothetical protein
MLQPVESLVPVHQYDKLPTYYIYAGARRLGAGGWRGWGLDQAGRSRPAGCAGGWGAGRPGSSRGGPCCARQRPSPTRATPCSCAHPPTLHTPCAPQAWCSRRSRSPTCTSSARTGPTPARAASTTRPCTRSSASQASRSSSSPRCVRALQPPCVRACWRWGGRSAAGCAPQGCQLLARRGQERAAVWPSQCHDEPPAAPNRPPAPLQVLVDDINTGYQSFQTLQVQRINGTEVRPQGLAAPRRPRPAAPAARALCLRAGRAPPPPAHPPSRPRTHRPRSAPHPPPTGAQPGAPQAAGGGGGQPVRDVRAGGRPHHCGGQHVGTPGGAAHQGQARSRARWRTAACAACAACLPAAAARPARGAAAAAGAGRSRASSLACLASQPGSPASQGVDPQLPLPNPTAGTVCPTS